MSEIRISKETAEMLKELGIEEKRVRPTQTYTAKILREEYNIHVAIARFKSGWDGWLEDAKTGVGLLDKYYTSAAARRKVSKTYEQALEIGLQQAIRLTIKRKENEKDS